MKKQIVNLYSNDIDENVVKELLFALLEKLDLIAVKITDEYENESFYVEKAET